ncbi:outer membrane protein assembly factor BamD [Pantoea sp. SoEX]|uniref:outer membrane protein assembly factor BamD n=1 Tax=Pantoea sp. SoEX TaxID=2576763 RepID=UPI0013583895|nr:outer membrane protein assembly factor BamD [Pantoea sp. SoEX]MXP51248.1 outer membrane protein assembly factor BamD [Pantoea sp. SoEX]
MKFIKYVSIFILSMAIMTGCSEFSIKEVSNQSLNEIYDIAQKNIRKGNLKKAIKYLKIIKNIDPNGPYAKQIQLDLIYIYYKNRDFNSEENIINHFINFYPKHPNMDYVMYMKGLTEMSMDNPASMKFFHFDRSSRDPEHAYNAFIVFLQLLRNYPKSEYATDAYNRLVYLKNRLANHELSIVSFYDKKKSYVAVINRVNNMLIYYPDTKATHDALPLMEKAYRKLQIYDEADKISKIILLNH